MLLLAWQVVMCMGITSPDVAGPYFYLPKMQSHKEARLWNDVFVEAQDLLNIPRGTIKVPYPLGQAPAP